MSFKEIYFGLFIILIVGVSCSKKDSSVTYKPYLYIVNGGTATASFSSNLLLFGDDEKDTINIIVATTGLFSTDVHFGLKVADTARQSYNTAYGTNYLAMPTNGYSLSDTAGVILKGYAADTLQVIFNQNNTANANYMLPLIITGGDGNDINVSTSTIYFHRISNTFAGVYKNIGTKIEYTGNASDTTVVDTIILPLQKSIIPVDNLYSTLDYGDAGPNGWQYNFTYSDDGVFIVVPNTTLTSSINPGSFKLLDFNYDSVTHYIHLKSTYKNSAGDERIVEETLTPQ